MNGSDVSSRFARLRPLVLLPALAVALSAGCAMPGTTARTATAGHPAPVITSTTASAAPPQDLPDAPGQVIVPADGRVVSLDGGVFGGGGVVGDGQTFAVTSYREQITHTLTAVATTFASKTGRYVLSTDAAPPVVLDLATGSVVRRQPFAIGMVGDSVVTEPDGPEDPDNSDVFADGGLQFLDIATGTRQGSLVDEDVEGGFTAGSDSEFAAVASKDGQLAIVVEGYEVVAVRMRGGIAWRVPLELSGGSYAFVDPATGVVVVSRENGFTLETVGLDPASGRRLWRQPTTEVCGVLDGRVAAIANEQLATLDAATGSQVAFDPTVRNCPMLIGGAFSYTSARGIVRFW